MIRILLLSVLLGPSPFIVPPPNNTAASGVTAFGSGTCTGADSTLYDNNGGAVGCPKLTDVAPQGQMFRAQPAFPGGTQTAAISVWCGGQDETTVTIDDFSQCEDSTVTTTVVNSNDASTPVTLTESELGGNDWNAVTSNAVTATNLAAQLNDGNPDGVTATAVSNVVRIVLDPDTCIVTLARSVAACCTVSVGTAGVNSSRRTLDMNALPIVNVGAAGTDFSATGGLTTADGITISANGLNVTGASVFQTGMTLNSFLYFNMGTTAGDATQTGFIYNTSQTPDSGMLALNTDSRVFLIAEKPDAATDFAKAQQTNPTLCLQSADATTTTDRICLAHNQTDGVLSTDGGALSIAPATSITNVTGIMNFTGSTRINTNTIYGVANAANNDTDGGIGVLTTQTPDALSLMVPDALNKLLLIYDYGDRGTDFAMAAPANPTLCLQSSDQTSITDRICMTHDQTDGAISTASGDITIQPNGGDLTIAGIVSPPSLATITVDAATTFAITRNVHLLDCTGPETIATITGGLPGALLTLIATDAECTFTDTNDGGADTLDLDANITTADDMVIMLVRDATAWHQAAPEQAN